MGESGGGFRSNGYQQAPASEAEEQSLAWVEQSLTMPAHEVSNGS